MKTIFFGLFITLSGALFAPVYADPGSSCHFHGTKVASESTVIQCANSRKDTLVKSGKLDKTWGTIKHDTIALVDGKKGKEWKVIFKNPVETDAEKNTLYMFFTSPGNFIAANFTGK